MAALHESGGATETQGTATRTYGTSVQFRPSTIGSPSARHTHGLRDFQRLPPQRLRPMHACDATHRMKQATNTKKKAKAKAKAAKDDLSWAKEAADATPKKEKAAAKEGKGKGGGGKAAGVRGALQRYWRRATRWWRQLDAVGKVQQYTKVADRSSAALIAAVAACVFVAAAAQMYLFLR